MVVWVVLLQVENWGTIEDESDNTVNMEVIG